MWNSNKPEHLIIPRRRPLPRSRTACVRGFAVRGSASGHDIYVRPKHRSRATWLPLGAPR